MKVREFVEKWTDWEKPDVDVCDNVCEELGIAYCSGGYALTEEGEEKFKDALNLEITVDEKYSVAIVDVNDKEGVWQKKLKAAEEFFYSIAGYCNDEDFDRWFVEVE